MGSCLVNARRRMRMMYGCDDSSKRICVNHHHVLHCALFLVLACATLGLSHGVLHNLGHWQTLEQSSSFFTAGSGLSTSISPDLYSQRSEVPRLIGVKARRSTVTFCFIFYMLLNTLSSAFGIKL